MPSLHSPPPPPAEQEIHDPAPQVLILHHQDRTHPGVQLSNFALQQQLRADGAAPLTLSWSSSYARTLGLGQSAVTNFMRPPVSHLHSAMLYLCRTCPTLP